MSVIKMYASSPIKPNTKLYDNPASGCVGPHENGKFVGFSSRDTIAQTGDLIDVVINGVVVGDVVFSKEEIRASE